MIFYKIAEHVIALDSSDEGLTKAVLNNFTPFLCSQKCPEAPLFCIKGEEVIESPQIAPADVLEWNGILYEVFSVEKWTIISMRIGDKVFLLQADSEWKNLRTNLSLKDYREKLYINNFLIVAFGMASAPYKTIKVHASVIEKDGRSILFLGKSGTGKSTHSSLWLNFVDGCTLLNDDEPIVRIMDDKIVVFGSPWSGKTPCYRNEQGDVVAFVRLRQYPENRIQRLSGVKAFAELFSSCCMMRSDDRNREYLINTAAEISDRIPMYQLDCLPDEGAVRLSEKLLEDGQR